MNQKATDILNAITPLADHVKVYNRAGDLTAAGVPGFENLPAAKIVENRVGDLMLHLVSVDGKAQAEAELELPPNDNPHIAPPLPPADEPGDE